jgi:dienelactone hydrolase
VTLAGFEETRFAFEGAERAVYRRGKGPAVVVIHEIPGIIPEVASFAARVADAGFSVYAPSLFGEPGRPFSTGYVLGQVARACVSREFAVLARRESSPVTVWLRALARHAFAEVGVGKGVGAIGMCLTGNFALAMTMDDAMLAPVLCQPSLPFPVLPGATAALHVSDAELENLRRRSRAGLRVLGLRFTEDPVCRAERFETLRREIGDAFEAVEIDSSRGNSFGIPRRAHSVVTRDLVDEPGHPTRAALDRVIAFFQERLV